MIKEIKYMIGSVLSSLYFDVTTGVKDLFRPKEILNMLFFLFTIEVFSSRTDLFGIAMEWILKITFGLILITYIWKIIKQGDYRKRIKMSEIK